MTTERIADHVKFAYWVPNVSGGLVTSDIEQRTDWNYEYNKKLAQTAENNGFEYALSQVRYEASYGAEYQHESTSFSLALLLATERLKVIAAVHPGLWQPAVLAKLGATADHLVNGRFAVNVVSGLVQGRVHPPRRAVAGTRRALPPQRGVPAGAAQDLDRGRRGLPRRLLPHPRLHAQAQAAQHPRAPQPGDLPGRQLDRRAPQRRAVLGLVLLQRQGLRRHHRAGGRGARPRPRPSAARSRSGSTGSSSPGTPRRRRRTPSARSSTRPTSPPSRASAARCSRRATRPATRRACGRTRRSRTSSSTTTASGPS